MAKPTRKRAAARASRGQAPRGQKHAGGRPSKYDPKFCDEMVAFCRQGYSLTAFAGEIGVSRECLAEWGRVHKEFFVALTRAKAAAARWWEDQGRAVGKGLGGAGSATVVCFQLKNMAGHDYRDAQQIEHSGIQVNITRSDEKL